MKSLAMLTAMNIAAFVNSNAGSKLFICTTPQPTDVDATTAAALTWVQIKGVGKVGETGPNTNVLSYNTWDTDVVQKSKGVTDGGAPQIELARNGTDAGQIALRAAALTNYNYVFKIERNDKPNSNVGSKPTTIFNRGLVMGPTHPNGGTEDFDLEIFTLGLNQKEIVVEAISA